MKLSRRQLKSDPSLTITAQTKQGIQHAATTVKETAYSLPFLTQNGVEYMDITLDDPCSLLASNDDPDENKDVATNEGIQGLDWDRVDLALLANCTSMPSGSPSYDRGISTMAVCSRDGNSAEMKYDEEGDDTVQNVVVTYVYKVETTAEVVSSNEFLEEMEGRILNEMKSKLCGGGGGGSSSMGGTTGESGTGESNSSGGDGSGSNGSVSEGSGVSGSGSSTGSAGLGIVSIDSSPNDVHIANGENMYYKVNVTFYSVIALTFIAFDVYQGACEATSPNAGNCFIIDGAITVTIDSSSDPAAAEETAREYIIDTMGSGSLLDSTTMPGVVAVDYLGETYEDYLFNEGGGSSIECPIVSSDATSTKEVLVSYVYEVESTDGASSSTFLPKLEGKILKEIATETCQNEGYTLLSIKSAPDDVKVSTGKCQ